MRWDELSSDQFPDAVKEADGVCLVPLSVIERHGHHLPLGTDMFIGRELCQRAAAQEPAIIFPDNIFTQIPEARHVPGTISIDGELILKLLDSICREISRNGMKKIVIVNAHGGNSSLLRYFNELQLYERRDYVVYLVQSFALRNTVEVPWQQDRDWHAGAGETSLMLAMRPDLVDMTLVPPDGEGKPLGRLDTLRAASVHTGIWWYADFPTHYAGDATLATADLGEQMLTAMSNSLAEAVRAVKADDTTQRLQDIFYRASSDPEN